VLRPKGSLITYIKYICQSKTVNIFRRRIYYQKENNVLKDNMATVIFPKKNKALTDHSDQRVNKV
jgi:hypothetical protein